MVKSGLAKPFYAETVLLFCCFHTVSSVAGLFLVTVSSVSIQRPCQSATRSYVNPLLPIADSALPWGVNFSPSDSVHDGFHLPLVCIREAGLAAIEHFAPDLQQADLLASNRSLVLRILQPLDPLVELHVLPVLRQLPVEIVSHQVFPNGSEGMLFLDFCRCGLQL